MRDSSTTPGARCGTGSQPGDAKASCANCHTTVLLTLIFVSRHVGEFLIERTRPFMVEPARRVSARLQAIPESATLAITAKAKQLKAAGEPVIGFGAGESDFPTQDYFLEAARAAVFDPAQHRYTPATGLPEPPQAIA